MGSYLRLLALFLLPVLLLLAGTERLLRRIPNDYSFKHRRMIEEGSSFKVLVLGNSHAYKGIDPDLMGSVGFNAANISQDLRYDRAILEKYLPSLPNLQHLVLPISYGSLGAELEQGRESWRVKNYVLYMGISEYATGLEHHLELVNRPMRDQVRMVRRYVQHGSDNRVCSESGTGSQRPAADLDLQRSGEDAAARHRRTSAEGIERSRHELERIVRLATERGIRVHLVTTPAYATYRNALNEPQLRNAISTCEHLARTNTLVDYIDLMADPRFLVDDFADADHLSVPGQRKLSRILGEWIGTLPSNTVQAADTVTSIG
ncbi:MAG TPA: hypothetical protein PLB89_15640, partial [Flavobacteriales bacterium]|nr:hypothetical protein [Flavobacteriales bacterium]